jgi:hypothetical protein
MLAKTHKKLLAPLEEEENEEEEEEEEEEVSVFWK